MYKLVLNDEITNIIVYDVSTETGILSDLEVDLDTEYPEQFPFGVYDIELLDRNDKYIELNIVYEDHEGMEKERVTLIPF